MHVLTVSLYTVLQYYKVDSHRCDILVLHFTVALALMENKAADSPQERKLNSIRSSHSYNGVLC